MSAVEAFLMAVLAAAIATGVERWRARRRLVAAAALLKGHVTKVVATLGEDTTPSTIEVRPDPMGVRVSITAHTHVHLTAYDEKGEQLTMRCLRGGARFAFAVGPIPTKDPQ